MLFTTIQVLSALEHYKYPLIFPLVALEGPFVSVAAGALSALGYLNLWIAYPVVMAGDLLADSLYYALGRYGKGKLIGRWGKYFGVSEASVQNLKKRFEVQGGPILFIGKISHGLGGAFLVAAGLAEMPFGNFIFYNALATIPKSLILLLIGYYFSHELSSISSTLDRLAFIFIIAAVLGLIGYFSTRRSKKDD